MKKILLILTLFFCTGISLHAQEDDPADDQGANKLQDRMREYVQKRLNLNRAEADKFSPVFIRYLLELRRTHREFQQDKPMQQLKIAELRIHYRDEFRKVLDDTRANRVFECEGEFKRIIIHEIEIRKMQQNRGGLRRNRMMLN